jgi:hypothetical protein
MPHHRNEEPTLRAAPRPSAGTASTAAPQASPHTPAPRLVLRLYAASNEALRAQLLTCLLRPLGLLGAAGAAAGAFSAFVLRRGAAPLVQADEVARVSTEQVLELARFAEQVDPQVLVQVADLLSTHSIGMAAFSAAAVVLLYRAVGSGGKTREMG